VLVPHLVGDAGPGELASRTSQARLEAPEDRMEAAMKERVRFSDLKFGPIQHPVLPDDFIERIKAFKKILSDFDTVSLEQTIDNFKRDTNPESELVIWERIAGTFQLYLSHNPTTDSAIRKDIFAVLLGASMDIKEFENIKHLSDQQIKHLVLYYHGP
jgi:hypothetical protein